MVIDQSLCQYYCLDVWYAKVPVVTSEALGVEWDATAALQHGMLSAMKAGVPASYDNQEP